MKPYRLHWVERIHETLEFDSLLEMAEYKERVLKGHPNVWEEVPLQEGTSTESYFELTWTNVETLEPRSCIFDSLSKLIETQDSIQRARDFKITEVKILKREITLTELLFV